MPEQEDLSEIQHAIRNLSPQEKFSYDAVGYSHEGLRYEAPSVKRVGKDSYQHLLREFLEADPIRLWLWQHSPVAHMIISRAAMKALSEGRTIDPQEVADEFERQRKDQDEHWRAFHEGATE